MKPFLLLILTTALFAQPRQIAITIDDLPRGGGDPGARDLVSVQAMTTKLLTPLRGIPLIGFVNAGRTGELGDAGLQTILSLWVKNGATLGNHTATHPSLNNSDLDEYTDDIVQGEAAITKALGHRPVYFRHPFLHTGPDEAKWTGLAKFLAARGYTVAPVTLDNSDWIFAAVYGHALSRGDSALAARAKAAYVPYMESVTAYFEQRSKQVVGHEIAQTLLIHASQLNADAMPDLLAMFRRRGYRFVSLADALKDDGYRFQEHYLGTNGISWIHRWANFKGMPSETEPDVPAWVNAEYQKTRK